MPPKKPISSVRKRGAAQFRTEALARLKARFESENDGEEFDATNEPTITPLLKSADGGIPRIIEALRAHDEEDARDFIEIYDSLTATDRKYLTLEEIAVASGIGSLRLGEVAQSAMILHGQLTTKLLLASSMSKVVAASLKEAVKPKGLVDREWMLKSGGILPVPKGAQIAIQTNVTREGAETKTLPVEDAVYLNAGQRLRMIHEAVEQRRLPAPPSDPVELGGALDKMQKEAAAVLAERENENV